MEERERIEEYLETLYRFEINNIRATTTNIRKALNVAPSSVTEMLSKLAEKSYVEYEKYRGVKLTEKGREIGRKIFERHYLLEEFLRFIRVKNEKVDEIACRIEHDIDEDVENGISKLLFRERSFSDLLTLNECEKGMRCIVVTYYPEKDIMDRIEKFGIFKISNIRIIEKNSVVSVELNGKKIDLDKEIGDKILVRKV